MRCSRPASPMASTSSTSSRRPARRSGWKPSFRRANGFVYVIAVTGVTGARGELAAGLDDYIARVRRHTQLPLAIGFGISRREHVARVEKLVDGVIFASALLNHLDTVTSDQLPAEAKGFRPGSPRRLGRANACPPAESEERAA